MEEWEPVFAALLLFLPGMCSIICSSYMIYSYATCQSDRTPFITICIGRCVSHFLNGLTYGIYFPIRILLAIFEVSWRSSWLDQLVGVCWLVLAPTELLLALNRVAAINFITKYTTIFSMRNTFVAIVASWILGASSYIYHLGCFVEFDPETFEVKYSTQECFERDRLTSEIIVFPCMAVSLFFSIIAFGQILVRTKKSGTMRHRRQWLLFAQAPSQILVWTIATLFWVSDAKSLIDTNLWKLSCMSLPQISAHALESVIILLFHAAYKRSSE